MSQKIIIKSNQESTLMDAIIYYMEMEKLNYVVTNDINLIDEDVTNLIYIDENDSDANQLPKKEHIEVIFVSGKKRTITSDTTVINYLITNLIQDDNCYTDVQKEYLFKKGIYHIFIERLNDLLKNDNSYNGMIYDLTEIKTIPDNWIFSFDSINDTYNWLSRKNRMLQNDFVRKVINFYDEKVYDDSLREINYLTEKLTEIKEGKKVIDLFICSKDELELFKQNYFFALLIKNISSTYKVYLIDKDRLFLDDKAIFLKLMDGVAIYNDCIYRDTYDNEISLGYVDCNENTIKEYNRYFDYILSRYGIEIKTERDLNEF